MENLNSIKILEVSNVTPSLPISDSPLDHNHNHDSVDQLTEFSLPLTFLDTFCFKFPPIQCLFFYTNPQTQDSNQSLIPIKLKHSLSQILNNYLPLAGTLTWPPNSPKPYVFYKPGRDAVSFTVAESTSRDHFTRLADKEIIHEADESIPLVPGLRIDDTSASIMAIQVTLFPGEGFCVGITAHHAFLDGKSTAMFMKSWAYINNKNLSPNPPLSLLPELTPFFDRNVVEDPNGLDMLYMNRWIEKSSSIGTKTKLFDHWPLEFDTSSDMVRGTFELTRGKIENLKIVASKTLGDDSTLTSFVVTSALVLTFMVKATLFEPDLDRKLYFIVGVDYRARLDPPVPSCYFGNCAGSHVGQARARECFEEDGFAVVAAKIRCLIKGVKEGVLAGAEERLVKWGCLEPDSIVVALTWSPKFGVYGVNFGFGKPKKVEIVSVHRNAISLVDSSSTSGGIEVGLLLKKYEMDRFASLFRTSLLKL